MTEILIVDDEPKIVLLVRMMLEREGYKVAEAGNGEECLNKLKEKKPDLILLDVMMPGENGWGICRKIKSGERTKDIPVVMLTVRSGAEAIARSAECGADAHIIKPFERAKLIETVKIFLKK